MKKLPVMALSGALILGICGVAYSQTNKPRGSFVGEVNSSAVSSSQSGQLVTKDTSREKPPFMWNPMNLPESGQLSQRVSNLKVTVIEQKSAGGGVQTLYVASGTYINQTEDDKTHIPATWTVDFKDKGGTTVDSFSFNVSHDHCSYSGEEPFTAGPQLSAFNLFDTIVSATARGYIPAGYRGGC
jgi:hypothetical protein